MRDTMCVAALTFEPEREPEKWMGGLPPGPPPTLELFEQDPSRLAVRPRQRC